MDAVYCSACHNGAYHPGTAGKPRPGNPFRHCAHCGRVYYDGDFAEPVILFYCKQRPGRAKLLSLLVVWGAVIAVAKPIVRYVSTCYPQLEPPLYGFLLLVSAVLAVIYLYHTLCRRFAPDAYLNNFENRKIKRLEQKKRPPQFVRSRERMSKESYLYELMAHGVVVPLYFFKRIQVRPDPREMTEASRRYKENCQQFSNMLTRQKESEKLSLLQNEAENYTYYLSLGLHHPTFRKQAEFLGMTPQAFEAHCQKELRQIKAKISKN